MTKLAFHKLSPGGCISETNQKFRSLRKNAQIVLMTSMERAIWNWMATYPAEFADLQVGGVFRLLM
jgi:hypothetical protein